MRSERPMTGRQILDTARRLVADRLPPGWSLSPGPSPGPIDAIWRIASPEGDSVDFAVELTHAMDPADVNEAVPRLVAAIATRVQGRASPLVVAPYLGPRTKELLVDRSVSYADVTGNLRLVATRPGLLVETVGETKNPWPDDQPLQSLKGRGAGRAVRAVVDFRPPYGVRELAKRANVSQSTISRVLDLLAREALVERERGTVTRLDWAGALRRWSLDYQLRRSNTTSSHLDPRGVAALPAKLRAATWPYAITGSLAAQHFAPVAPARQAVVYVDDPAEAAQGLGLRPADTGANVLLVEPFDPVVFERTITNDDLVSVAPTQLATDLLTGPGREPAEAEELLAWMGRNEDAWRA